MADVERPNFKQHTFKPIPNAKPFSSTNQPTAEQRRLATSIKQAMLDSFDILGGTAFLVGFVRKNDENARCYVNGIMRMLPLEVQGSLDTSLTIKVVSLAGDNAIEIVTVPKDAAPVPALPAATGGGRAPEDAGG